MEKDEKSPNEFNLGVGIYDDPTLSFWTQSLFSPEVGATDVNAKSPTNKQLEPPNENLRLEAITKELCY